MTRVGPLLNRIGNFGLHPAIVWRNMTYTYTWIHTEVATFTDRLSCIPSGAVVGLMADYSPASITVFFALVNKRCVVCMLNPKDENSLAWIENATELDWLITVDNEQCSVQPCSRFGSHSDLILQLQQDNHPGLILLTSGTDGVRKAVVHDMERLLKKYEEPKSLLTTLGFLFFDHIAGIDNLFYTFLNGGTFVVPDNRSPDAVFRHVEQNHIELLSVSPTFIRLALLERVWEKWDTSSLKIIAYGSEVMPKPVLDYLRDSFPHVKILQKFGMSEIGSPKTRTSSLDGLWIQLTDSSFEHRVVDDVLWIRSEQMMLGYLNAPSPFSDDGWLCTNDVVETDGKFIHILGRKSRVINVGGEKVHPIEVESVIAELPEVADVTVYGEPNALLGNIVVAEVVTKMEVDQRQFRKGVQKYCETHLPPYKVPMKVVLTKTICVSDRMKKVVRKSI